MPLVDPHLAETWASAYTGGYTRSNAVVFRLVQKDAATLRERLGVVAGQSICMLGSGFGWEAEEWQAAGLGPIVCADFSTWIHANKPGNATVTILNEDGSTATSRNNIKQAGNITGNNKYDFIISMDTMPWLDDDECGRLASVMRDLGTHVVHFLSVAEVNKPPVGNWRKLSEWKTFFGTDTVVERGNDYRMM